MACKDLAPCLHRTPSTSYDQEKDHRGCRDGETHEHPGRTRSTTFGSTGPRSLVRRAKCATVPRHVSQRYPTNLYHVICDRELAWASAQCPKVCSFSLGLDLPLDLGPSPPQVYEAARSELEWSGILSKTRISGKSSRGRSFGTVLPHSHAPSFIDPP